MDVSIVAPFYNEERHIEGAIRALLAFDYPEDRYEILMVDNNSTDGSAEIVKRYPRVRLCSEPRQGDFAARNRGIAESTGEIIAFTDCDTAPHADWIHAIRKEMENPRTKIVVGALRFSERSRPLQLMADYESAKNEYIFGSDVPEIYYGYTCNLAVRRSVFDELGPYPEVFRNSDVVMVRKVVDAFSCDAVVFGRQVNVLRLEVASFASYLQKQVIYGRDLKRYASIADARPLNTKERFEAFRLCTRMNGYGPLKSAALLSLLTMGAAAYEYGRLRGR